VGKHRKLAGRQPPDLAGRRAVKRGDALHEVREQLRAQPALPELPLQPGRPVGGMRRAAAAHVPHAGEDHARRDAAPDAVADAQLALHHQVDDVVRQPRPGRAAVEPVRHPVVSFHQRIAALVVRQPGEGHAHIPTMRTRGTGRLMVFAVLP
jgi:hypothetical protein